MLFRDYPRTFKSVDSKCSCTNAIISHCFFRVKNFFIHVGTCCKYLGRCRRYVLHQQKIWPKQRPLFLIATTNPKWHRRPITALQQGLNTSKSFKNNGIYLGPDREMYFRYKACTYQFFMRGVNLLAICLYFKKTPIFETSERYYLLTFE